MDPHKYGESILLAVSGGVDSTVMADLFVDNDDTKFYKIRLGIAHCNFHLRGDESDGDEAFVRGWASAHAVEYFSCDFETETFALENGISIEMAARELRYRWFDSLCREHGFTGVCVAHNANDNAETLMLNLLRGTGLAGVCGMEEIARNPYGDSLVFRPLLQCSRAEIVSYAAEHGLSFRTDSTNASSDVKRNLLRNVVFPQFEKINPSFIVTIGRDIAHFRQARDIVDDVLKGELESLSGNEIDISSLKARPHWQFLLFSSMQRRGFTPSVIASVTDLLESDRVIGGKRFEGGACTAVTTSTKLIFFAADAVAAKPVVELLPWTDGMSPKTERGVILMDADSVAGQPRFRQWRNGDYLFLMGLKGKKKVSDLLTDLKYDISRKKAVLVVEGQGSHVLAVVGERIDESVKVTPSTRRVYRISIL